MASDESQTKIAGKYILLGEIGTGGMAQVHLGQVEGALGFSRNVAIKRLHAHLAKDPDFVAMLIDEAKLAGRIHHPNVVSTLDVVSQDGELFVVMEYVHGASLSALLSAAKARNETAPLGVALRIMSDMLTGLHAAHEAADENGQLLGIVYRDVSPQNVLVGADGMSRLIDFGIAKARDRVQTTREGELKGKLAYMAPEQLMGLTVDRRCDLYGAGVTLWELVAARRYVQGMNEGQIVTNAISGEVPLPSEFNPNVPPDIERVILRALARDREARFSTAAEMAAALESHPSASAREVADWFSGSSPISSMHANDFSPMLLGAPTKFRRPRPCRCRSRTSRRRRNLRLAGFPSTGWLPSVYS